MQIVDVLVSAHFGVFLEVGMKIGVVDIPAGFELALHLPYNQESIHGFLQ
jgi:hypothetical protein